MLRLLGSRGLRRALSRSRQGWTLVQTHLIDSSTKLDAYDAFLLLSSNPSVVLLQPWKEILGYSFSSSLVDLSSAAMLSKLWPHLLWSSWWSISVPNLALMRLIFVWTSVYPACFCRKVPTLSHFFASRLRKIPWKMSFRGNKWGLRRFLGMLYSYLPKDHDLCLPTFCPGNECKAIHSRPWS